MRRFSILSLLRNALTDHREWQPHWRDPEPKPGYDALIDAARECAESHRLDANRLSTRLG